MRLCSIELVGYDKDIFAHVTDSKLNTFDHNCQKHSIKNH